MKGIVPVGGSVTRLYHITKGVSTVLFATLLIIFLYSCNKDDELETIQPQLISFVFSQEQNRTNLIENAEGKIIGDSVVECWVPYLLPNKKLIPQITAEGGVLLDGAAYEDEISYDFSRPVNLTISKGLDTKTYIVYVHTFTGLPVIWIETEGRKEIESKEDYLKASFILVENVITRAAGDIMIDSVNVKGRGNSTWDFFPKKPYRLKFDHKVPLFDDPADKSWVLLANYADKTMLRHKVAYYISSLSNLDYTPRSHFAELMLNGRYNGTYLVCEKLKIAKNRVNVGDDGYLLEVDYKERLDQENDSRYFIVEHIYRPNTTIKHPVNIKEPQTEYNDENYTFVKDFVTTADSVLFSDGFKDENTGWQKYMDIESFADWYVINEICKPIDATLRSSCFMNLKRNGKLKMGPVWDFDNGFGNSAEISSPEGLYVKSAPWFTRLFEDPLFLSKVKERFAYIYSQRDKILKEINDNCRYLKYASQENENRWHTLYTYTIYNYDIWGSYQNEVQYMKNWLITRLDWLKVEFDRM